MIIHSANGPELMAAYAGTLSDVKGVTKRGTAEIETAPGKDDYGYDYAKLADVLAEIKRACADHGLVIAQNGHTTVTEHGTQFGVTTYIIHPEHGYIEFPPLAGPVPANPQKVGSAMTYYKRYALVAIFALPTVDDDDGGGAVRGMKDEAAEQGHRAVEAKTTFDRLGALDDDVKAELARLRELHGHKLTKAGLMDDEWRHLIIETIDAMTRDMSADYDDSMGYA